jgi:hypothetical protein
MELRYIIKREHFQKKPHICLFHGLLRSVRIFNGRKTLAFIYFQGPSWSWSYGICIYNYLCNHYLLPLKLWVWIPFMAMCTVFPVFWFLSKQLKRSTKDTWLLHSVRQKSGRDKYFFTERHNMRLLLIDQPTYFINNVNDIVYQHSYQPDHSILSMRVIFGTRWPNDHSISLRTLECFGFKPTFHL